MKKSKKGMLAGSASALLALVAWVIYQRRAKKETRISETFKARTKPAAGGSADISSAG